MADEVLSQREIDELIRSRKAPKGEDQAADNAAALTEEEVDVLGEIGNISMGSAATALSTLVNQRVVITTPRVSVVPFSEVVEEFPVPCVVIKVEYIEGLAGGNYLVMQTRDAAVVADLMMGGDGSQTKEELEELELSAMAEAMNMMMGSAATAMSSMFDTKVEISPPTAEYRTLSEDDDVASDPVVKIAFELSVGDLIKSQIVNLMDVRFAKQLAGRALKQSTMSPSEQPVAADEDESSLKKDEKSQGAQAAQQTRLDEEAPQFADLEDQEQARPKAPSFLGSARGGARRPPFNYGNLNIDLIRDIPVTLTAQLGRARLTVDKVLELTTGSVVQLDTLEGQSIEVRANGKLVARGEIVVVKDKFAIRITEVVSRAERMESLG